MKPSDDDELECRFWIRRSVLRKLEELDAQSMIGRSSMVEDLIERAFAQMVEAQTKSVSLMAREEE